MRHGQSLWGRLIICGGLPTRLCRLRNARGTPIDNRRQDAILPHKAFLLAGLLCLLVAGIAHAQAPERPLRGELLTYPGPWRFQWAQRGGRTAFTTDEEFEQYVADGIQGRGRFMQSLEALRASGGDTMRIFFDYFYRQKTPGREDAPRRYLPDSDAYIGKIAALSRIAQKYGVGFSLSFLSPLEIGHGYTAKTGETGVWLQYRKGLRDPKTGAFSVQMWRQSQWSNNKGVFQIKPGRVRVFAFQDEPIPGTVYRVVDPASIVELKDCLHAEVYDGLMVKTGDAWRHPPGASPHASNDDYHAQRIRVYGTCPTGQENLNRVIVVQELLTPEMDYFSRNALPFLTGLVDRYLAAGVKINGLYADEMHIQGDWVKKGHEDDGEFALRYMTDSMAARYAELYGTEYRDFARFMVYFVYGQEDTASDMSAKQGVMHVFGPTPDDIRRTALFRARYFHLLNDHVVDLFTEAKHYAERKVGYRLDAPNHATWSQSPTMDYWATENEDTTHALAYEYTSNFIWSNSVQQASVAAHDYFKWGDFMTGNGSDHAEASWLDRDYFCLALSASLGIVNREVPYAYAVGWGYPAEVVPLRNAVVNAYGDRGAPIFQNVQNAEHRDVDVLMLYPLDLVATEERFGTWMTQYGYANMITPTKLLELGSVKNGVINLAGRRFTTLAAVFEPFPPRKLLAMMQDFVTGGGRLIWSGPPPVLTFEGEPALEIWKSIFGVDYAPLASEGKFAAGTQVTFLNRLARVEPQIILTDFLPDHIYPVSPREGVAAVAKVKRWIVGTYRAYPGGGSATFLGYRPRDDQSASLGYETRNWFEILDTLGAYPPSGRFAGTNDNTEYLSRTTGYLVTRFPNGSVSIAPHLTRLDETWNGGGELPKSKPADFEGNPLPSGLIHLADFRVNGHRVSYEGSGALAFRVNDRGALIAFAGGQAREIAVDGNRTVFADRPLDEIGWAPVAECRRVPGGAVVQIRVRGAGAVRIPAGSISSPFALAVEGPTPGSRGASVPFRIEKGSIIFEATPQLNGRWIYLIPKEAHP